MSKFKLWLIIILALITLGLLGWNLSVTRSGDTDGKIVEDGTPTYKTRTSSTLAYEPTGLLAYRLNADDVQNFAQEKITWFTNPVLTTYDPDKTATWTIRAKRAKLTNDRMLYLYGDVQVDSLTTDTQLRQITTDNAEVNLITQDVSSDDKVTITGTGLRSVGLQMRGNLRNRNAELIKDVQTYYEIPNESKHP